MPHQPSLPASDHGTYRYDARRYRSDVEIPGYGSVAFVLLGIWLLIFPPTVPSVAGLLRIASVVLVVAGVYSLQRTFVAHAYPREVVLDAEGIEFASFGARARFSTDELEACSVREAQMGRAFVRVRSRDGRRGRYFLSFKDMRADDGRDGFAIQRYLFAQEERLDPEGIRVKARKRNR